MGVPFYTTPTFTLTFSERELDLTQAQSVYVTFRSGTQVITKTGNQLTIGEKTIGVSLTQEETASFESSIVNIQANWMISGKRIASVIAQCDLDGQLLTRVIE